VEVAAPSPAGGRSVAWHAPPGPGCGGVVAEPAKMLLTGLALASHTSNVTSAFA